MPKSTPTLNGHSKRRLRTHAALVSAAQELLGEGRTHATIEEITTRAGVGFGSFHNHFASREELFREGVLATLDGFGALLSEATAGETDPAERFARSFRMTGRLAAASPDLLAPLHTIGTDVFMVDRGLRPLALADLREGVASGRFVDVDPEVLLAAVGGALLGLVRLLDERRDLAGPETADQFTGRLLCFLGLSPDEAHQIATRPLDPA